MKIDLLIIGGGVLGTFHAFHALDRGLSVALLERHASPCGATVRNFGQVVPSGLDADWQPIGRESVRIYESIQAEFDISVRRDGSLYVASDDDELTLLEELSCINQQDRYPSQLWTPDRCRDRYPQLRSDYCRGGLFFPEEISLNPRKMIHQLHAYLSGNPQFQGHFRTCVNELVCLTKGRVSASTTDGKTFIADNAILCGGNEFQLLFPEMFDHAEIEVVKLQMLRLKSQPNVSIPGNVLTGKTIRRYESFSKCRSWNEIKSREPSDDPLKRWGIHILLKQEADGSIILGDSHEYASVKQSGDLGYEQRHEIAELLISEGHRIMDLPHWDVESSWCGFYSQTKQSTGIFTATIDDHIHIVTGIGGKGMTISPQFAKQHLQELLDV